MNELARWLYPLGPLFSSSIKWDMILASKFIRPQWACVKGGY
jgi:hypothetical protein